MGGTRGSQSYGWDSIDSKVEYTAQLYKANNKLLTDAQVKCLEEEAPIGMSNLPFFISSADVNLRSAFSNASDSLPLQFSYQAADCRLFYTALDRIRPENTWSAAANAIWGNGSCVANSTGALGSQAQRAGLTNGTTTGDGSKSIVKSGSTAKPPKSGAMSVRASGSMLSLVLAGAFFVLM
ncbi:hypothetical protein F5Y16DRAFT_394156 [Xylariaceae sp. FL0255]|nr:hypothetical protein F5Y16DRAFT_394156 [Xylariaceae sp. FL0255]